MLRKLNSITAKEVSGSHVDVPSSTSHCTVAHGPHEKRFPVAGKTVEYVRQNLQPVFNISPDSLAVVNRDTVLDEAAYIIPPGARIVFLPAAGFKGLGELLTSRQLKQRWKITEPQYKKLLGMGLPTIEFSGEVRHLEEAVDEWSRRKGTQVFHHTPTQPPLTSKEVTIVDTLRDAKKPLQAKAIAKRINCNNDGSFRAILKVLCRLNVLTKDDGGYGLPEWRH